jgi:predicted DsbA family dithiol-disulfide isomerase
MLHLAAEHGTASEFMDTVQRDLLGEGINAYTAADLADAASKGGVPAGEPRPSWRVTSTPTPCADEKLAREAGVTAVPFTVFGEGRGTRVPAPAVRLTREPSGFGFER